ncbi:phospholipase D-like domain-containing protein [Algiphilus sp.]|uniref:phospholipase D-like domain-containing protein n=1 Tax=Algiphilus sp. TaxID=1872431 RepID=UPI003B526FE3
MARPSTSKRPLRFWLLRGGLALALLYLATFVWHQWKPLPEGVNVTGPWRSASVVRFHADSTWLDAEGTAHSEQAIFSTAFAMIEAADRLAVADFFLVNRFAGQASAGHRPLSGQLVEAFVTGNAAGDDRAAALVTDPFNTLYGGVEQPLFTRLRQSDVAVIETDLTRLRDPNPLWSAAWRICCQWWGNTPHGGWLPNLVGEGRVSLRTYLTMLNFKANHRKTVTVVGADGAKGLVTSANPHDASSRHDNVAFSFNGAAVGDLLETERSVATFSGAEAPDWPRIEEAIDAPTALQVRILTEAAIRDAALAMIAEAGEGDALDLLMFYLAHRDIVRALIDAHARGASVRVLLDPNEDAFGRTKNGIPNRQVAWELHAAGVPVRWCNTSGEQCHSKMLVLRPANGPMQVLAGSANFTRRNLDNYNLETNVQLRGPRDEAVMQAVSAFFATRWANRPDQLHSLAYDRHADHSRWRYWQYRLMEATGLSTF